MGSAVNPGGRGQSYVPIKKRQRTFTVGSVHREELREVRRDSRVRLGLPR
jgi:hypothetical protein